jgi:hypothetical protein
MVDPKPFFLRIYNFDFNAIAILKSTEYSHASSVLFKSTAKLFKEQSNNKRRIISRRTSKSMTLSPSEQLSCTCITLRVLVRFAFCLDQKKDLTLVQLSTLF